MYCNYAGSDCIIPLQVENGCEDCEVKRDVLSKKKEYGHLMRFLTYEKAREIANDFFGIASAITESDFCYTAVIGSITLQILREIRVPGQVYCRVFVLHKSVGYFNYDIKTGKKSRFWKED